MATRIDVYASLRVLVLGLLFFGGTIALIARPATASGVLEAAAANGSGGLNACASYTRKALYDCVASVLDQMSREVGSANVGSTATALQTAASGLRSATTKAQALSAINACRSAIGSALQQVKALAGKYVPGWGDSGLSAISAVVNRAAQLIQSKG